MDHFEQQFRDQWNNRQEPDFQEGDWSKLEGRLKGQNSRRWAGWLLLLLPWLGIGGLLYLLLDMHHQLDALQAGQSTSPAIVDTLVEVHKQVTHDTVHIYHTVIYRDTVFIYAENIADAGINSLADQSSSHLSRSDGSDDADHNMSPSIAPHPSISSLTELEWQNLKMLPADMIGSVQTVSQAKDALPVQEMEYSHTPDVNLLRKTLYHMRPSGIALTGGGSGLIPVGNGIRQGSGYSLGVNGALRYGEHWQLGLGASFNQMSFEVHKFETALGVPAVDPPSENFDFVAAEVIRPFIALDLEGRYTLPGRSRLSPFFEGGLRVILTQPYEVLYDFQDPNTGVTWTYENSPSGEIKMPAQISLGAGLKYRLGTSWCIGIQGNYLHSLSQTNPVPHHAKAGGFVQYEF